MGVWLYAIFFVIIVINGHYDRRNNFTQNIISQKNTSNEKAMRVVIYMDGINDHLYNHPRQSGVLTEFEIGVKVEPDIRHIIQDGRAFVYLPSEPGLMDALKRQTVNSALLGTVENRLLIDNKDVNMLISVPGIIPNGYIVYLN